MTAEYVFRGESLDYTNGTGSDIAAGDVVALATFVGIAGCDIPDGETGTVHVTGVFKLPNASSAAIDQGAKVYWNGTGIVTTSSSNTLAGYAAAPAAANAETILVKLVG